MHKALKIAGVVTLLSFLWLFVFHAVLLLKIIQIAALCVVITVIALVLVLLFIRAIDIGFDYFEKDKK